MKDVAAKTTKHSANNQMEGTAELNQLRRRNFEMSQEITGLKEALKKAEEYGVNMRKLARTAEYKPQSATKEMRNMELAEKDHMRVNRDQREKVTDLSMADTHQLYLDTQAELDKANDVISELRQQLALMVDPSSMTNDDQRLSMAIDTLHTATLNINPRPNPKHQP